MVWTCEALGSVCDCEVFVDGVICSWECGDIYEYENGCD